MRELGADEAAHGVGTFDRVTLIQTVYVPGEQAEPNTIGKIITGY